MLKTVRLFAFFSLLFLLSVTAWAQDTEKVTVSPEEGQTTEQLNADKEQCYTHADTTLDATGHKTIKNTGAGAVVGAVAGKILGKPGAGAVVGGAAGAYRGHKKSGQDEKAFNEIYASCLRDKGYSVEVEED